MDLSFLSSWQFYGIMSIAVIYWYSTKDYNYWSKRGINGPKPKPFVGNLIDQFITPKPYLELAWFKKYGKFYGIYNGSKPTLTIADPELIKNILVKDFHIFTDRVTESRIHPILSKQLFGVTGDDWKRIRSIVSPTFTSGKMRKMYPMIRECLKELIQVLDNYAEEGRDVNIKDMFGNYTMDVIATCAFATKTNAHIDPNNPFIQSAIQVFNPKLWRLIPKIILPRFMLKLFKLHSSWDESANEFFFQLTRHIINERKGSSDGKHNDFIQLLLNAGLNEDEILANSWVFFIAGYESTATTLTFATYELALNDDIQRKLYEEVLSSVDSNGDIDYDLLSKLPYLDSVISETLRLHCPVMRLERQASEDYKLGSTGIIILKGQSIEIPIYAMQHSEEFYEEPFKFNPDRFMPGNKHKIIPYTNLPFGAGRRNCVAKRFALMGAKLCLAQVVRRFRLYPNSQTDVPLILKKSHVLHSPKRVVLGIEKRE